MVTARPLRDENGNILVTIEHRWDHDSYRLEISRISALEISRMAMHLLRQGDAFMIAMGRDGTPQLDVVSGYSRSY